MANVDELAVPADADEKAGHVAKRLLGGGQPDALKRTGQGLEAFE